MSKRLKFKIKEGATHVEIVLNDAGEVKAKWHGITTPPKKKDDVPPEPVPTPTGNGTGIAAKVKSFLTGSDGPFSDPDDDENNEGGDEDGN